MYTRDDDNLGWWVQAAQAAVAVAGMLGGKRKRPQVTSAAFPQFPAYGDLHAKQQWFIDFTVQYNELLTPVKSYRSPESKSGAIRRLRGIANEFGVTTNDAGDITGMPGVTDQPPAPPPSSGVIVAPPPPPVMTYQPATVSQPAPQVQPSYPYPYPYPPPPPPPEPSNLSQWAMPLAIVAAAMLGSRHSGGD